MKNLIFLALLMPYFGLSQTNVDIQTSTATWGPAINNNNTVHVDSVLIEYGMGQGAAFKFCLVLFDTDCLLMDNLEIGQYDPFNSEYQVYHFRQIQTFDMAQLDSTLKYRITDGTHYFLYTPALYRSDFVSSAYLPFYQTIDSLWGSQAANATTVMILYGVKGSPSSHESVIAQQGETEIEFSKTICEDARINEFEEQGNILIYPNPVDTELHIGFQSEGNRLLRIIDTSGQVIKHFNTTNILSKIDLSELPSGYYLLSVSDEIGSYFHRLILE